jgi:hypothetical protein
MAGSPARKRHFGSIILSVACIGVAAAVGWSIVGKRTQSQAIAAPGDVTGSISSEAQRPLGPSGLPIPRFVSLKAEKVNVRRGPSSDHPVAWVFQRKGLPVEIVAEFENWRRVRDSDGEEGWILQNMLSGKRTAVIAPGSRARRCRSRTSPSRRAPGWWRRPPRAFWRRSRAATANGANWPPAAMAASSSSRSCGVSTRRKGGVRGRPAALSFRSRPRKPLPWRRSLRTRGCCCALPSRIPSEARAGAW